MDREYHALPIRELGAGAGVRRPTYMQASRVTLESGALEVMTDLTRVSPATIRPQAPLAGANQFMITRGVRLLLVADDQESVLGVITATDILGERPMLAATERGRRGGEPTGAGGVGRHGARHLLHFTGRATARRRAPGGRRGGAHLLRDRGGARPLGSRA